MGIKRLQLEAFATLTATNLFLTDFYNLAERNFSKTTRTNNRIEIYFPLFNNLYFCSNLTEAL